MDKTGFGLPLHIDIANGGSLEPTGLDPYALPWAQGAASTVHLSIRTKYRSQVTDLREKLAHLRSKRVKDTDFPAWGPRRRSRVFSALDQRPFPEDGVVWGNEPAEQAS